MKLGILGTGHVATVLCGVANPGVIGPSSVFLSGDDPAAKQEAAGLLRDLGWPDDDIVDPGGPATARGPERSRLVLPAGRAAEDGGFQHPLHPLTGDCVG
jgi:predicted dinucleotide-binding enzyme